MLVLEGIKNFANLWFHSVEARLLSLQLHQKPYWTSCSCVRGWPDCLRKLSWFTWKFQVILINLLSSQVFFGNWSCTEFSRILSITKEVCSGYSHWNRSLWRKTSFVSCGTESSAVSVSLSFKTGLKTISTSGRKAYIFSSNQTWLIVLCSHIGSVHEVTSSRPLGGKLACSEIFEIWSGTRNSAHQNWQTSATWLVRFWLGGLSIDSPVSHWILCSTRRLSDLIEDEETRYSQSLFRGG